MKSDDLQEIGEAEFREATRLIRDACISQGWGPFQSIAALLSTAVAFAASLEGEDRRRAEYMIKAASSAPMLAALEDTRRKLAKGRS